jgi:hypothetical protein
MESAHDKVLALVKRVKMMPYDINNGFCEEFAEALSLQLPGSYVVSTPLGGDYPPHDFVKYRGRYYDAEAPYGVIDPIELPIFKRVSGSEKQFITNESRRFSKYGVSRKEWMRKYYG